MVSKNQNNDVSNARFDALRKRARILMLLDAAEQASITPLAVPAVHTLAYLADILSPVWGLPAFTSTVLKITGGPFYRDLQKELDSLVVVGLVEINDLQYENRPRGGARIKARYGLNFDSPDLERILSFLGARAEGDAFDNRDARAHRFLVELTNAFASLVPNQLDRLATFDVTWREGAHLDGLLEVQGNDLAIAANLSVATTERFENFLPDDLNFDRAEKLFLYAKYLGRQTNG